jgi:uncharacterized membrane protein HdeD (DUF308 family)
VFFGLAALLWPRLTLFVLVIYFGAYFLVDGVMGVAAAFQGRSNFRMWWLLLIEGLVGIVIGIMTFFWPAITAIALLYVVASWAIVTGIFEIAAAFTGRLHVAHELTLALAGVVSILFGVFLVLRPAAGLLALVWGIGIYALLFGVLLLIRAFQFRHAFQPSAAGSA